MTNREPPGAPPPVTPASLSKRGLRLLIGGFAEKSGLWRMRGRIRPGDYFRFLALHPRRLGFCLLWVTASGMGQTFFLSIYQPHWIDSLGLSPASMGALYGIATLGSALLLRKFGLWVDRASPRLIACVAALGLAFGGALAAASFHWAVLLASIFLLRLFGQGLSSMLGTTSAARWFPADQNKAVSVAGLGYPLGEAIFPVILIFSIGAFGWRYTSLGAAAVALLLLWPISLTLSGRGRHQKKPVPDVESATPSTADTKSFYRDRLFLLTLLVTAPLPFFATGIIFFQATLAAQMSWPSGMFATGFISFAVTRAVVSLGAGAVADKIGPMRLLGAPLLFFAFGMLFLVLPGVWGVYVFFVCMGLAFGVAGATTTSIWGVLFGMDRLGEARGAGASITVFTTAVSPFLFGALFESGLPPQPILIGCALSMLFISWPVSRWIRRRHSTK